MVEAIFSDHKEYVHCVRCVVVCGIDGGQWQRGPPTFLPRVISWAEFLAPSEAVPLHAWPIFNEDAAAFLCYTSGTTGDPKGVAYSHRSTYVHIIAQGHGDVMDIRGSDTILSVVPMFHAAGWAVPLVGLMLGCRIVLISRFMDPEKITDAIVDTGTTIANGVPTIWQTLRQALIEDPAKAARVKGVLKTLICGGSAPPQEMMMWFLAELGVEFRHLWGMTEMNPVGSVAHFVQTQEDLKKTKEERAEKLRNQGMPFYCVEWMMHAARSRTSAAVRFKADRTQ